MTEPSQLQPDVTVYWRPGCSYCASLVFRLDRAGIAYTKRNIWEDDDGRQFVRSVARGNETVPTVTVGEDVLVNPTFRHLVTAIDGKPPPRRRFRRRRTERT